MRRFVFMVALWAWAGLVQAQSVPNQSVPNQSVPAQSAPQRQDQLKKDINEMQRDIQQRSREIEQRAINQQREEELYRRQQEERRQREEWLSQQRGQELVMFKRKDFGILAPRNLTGHEGARKGQEDSKHPMAQDVPMVKVTS